MAAPTPLQAFSTSQPKQENGCSVTKTSEANGDRFLVNLPDKVRDAFKPCFSRYADRYEIQDFVITGDLTPQEISHAILVLQTANDPCGVDNALKAVTALRLRTNSKPESTNDIAAMVTLYAGDMAEYPLDVVESACRDLARSSRWFPAWSDLYEAMEWRLRRRRLMLKAAVAFEARQSDG